MYTDNVVRGGVVISRSPEDPTFLLVLVDFPGFLNEHANQIEQPVSQAGRSVDVGTRSDALHW
jgi:hypothetical protein